MAFMKQYRESIVGRIRDLTESVVMSIAAEQNSNTRPIDEGELFIPPKTGFLHLELYDAYTKKTKFNILTEIDCNNIIKVSSQIGSRSVSQLMNYALHSVRIRYNEALIFFDTMMLDIGNKYEVLSMLLPHMLLPLEARALVANIINEDPVELDLLKNKLGNILKPILGLPCGMS
jgi:hypothetical protein